MFGFKSMKNVTILYRVMADHENSDRDYWLTEKEAMKRVRRGELSINFAEGIFMEDSVPPFFEAPWIDS
jgi:hypothetical protein